MDLPTSRTAQRGAGLWGTLFIFAVIAFVALVTIKLVPVYLNQMKVSAAVREVSQESALGANADAYAIRKSLQRHWDIEDIEYIQPADIDIVRNGSGETLSYDYEARVHLFYNLFVVVHFTGSAPMAGGGG